MAYFIEHFYFVKNSMIYLNGVGYELFYFVSINE